MVLRDKGADASSEAPTRASAGTTPASAHFATRAKQYIGHTSLSDNERLRLVDAIRRIESGDLVFTFPMTPELFLQASLPRSH